MPTISSIKSALVALVVAVPFLLGSVTVDPRMEVFTNELVPYIIEEFSKDISVEGLNIERNVNKIILFDMQDLQLEEETGLVNVTSFSTRIEYIVKVTDTNNGFTETAISSQEIIFFYKGAEYVDALIFPSYKVKVIYQGRELETKIPIDALELPVSHVPHQGHTLPYQNAIV